MSSPRATLGRCAPVGHSLAVAILLALGSFSSYAQGADPETEKLYAALVEPSLADDGVMTSEERRAILSVAARMLDADGLRALEQRIETATTPPATQVGFASSGDPWPQHAHPHDFTGSFQDTGHAGHDEFGFLVDDPVDDCDCEGLFDNVSLFIGLDGSKQPQDLGVNAHFGGRTSVNWGFPLLRELGLGGQIGTSLNYSDSAVKVLEELDGTKDRLQNFTTVGVFQRTAIGLNWALAYDFLTEEYFESLSFGQWRGQVGYEVGESDEVGVWAAISDRGDSASYLGTPLRLSGITQGNLYWRHTWPNLARTGIWAGVAEGHGGVVFVFPDDSPSNERFVFGSDVYVPLNEWIALFGEANFISPSDAGTVDAYLGFAFYPGGGAREVGTRRFAPLLPVANNPTFAIDLER